MLPVDAPEIEHRNKKGIVSKQGQPFGNEAYNALKSKVEREIVNVDVINIDRYKRLVGVIKKENRNINKEMVSDGWAWAYRQYIDRPHASEYITAEEQARGKRLGLWKQSNPQPPWEFRKLQKQKGRK
jgi:micrococcal nuclease